MLNSRSIYICYFCLFLLVTSFVLNGCNNIKEAKPVPISKHEAPPTKEDIPITFLGHHFILPIKIPEGRFYSTSGWIDEQTILYITETGPSTNVYTYNFHNGVSQQLFKSDAPIVNVMISPQKKYILIHSSPNNFEATLTVLNIQGEKMMTQSIESTELAIEWNPFNEDILLVSSFTEDWSFYTYKMNLSEQKLDEVFLTQPFAYWLNEEELVYLDWDEESPSLFAPVKKLNLITNEENELFPKIFQIAMIGHKLLTIQVDENNTDQSINTIYSSALKEIRSFTLPQLSTYSGWLVPNYDYIETEEKLLTFAPLTSGSIDSYRGGYQLILKSLQSEDQEILFENLNNERLSCSPSGKYCLYGNYLDSILDLNEKNILKLIKE
ncbi:hypothetical protein SM124_04490 (plasmid) [Bacillus sp. 31A1R]|uniref:YqgU-like 6-bladed beta-propeller domain-containing protein n=1 Tax=Robertmurraya mangrovi TaxID=3098077 RepID=A0ABU5IV34_9BACI|nr:hypothetical protein [Bacillus sp. 31A1R]MDZ5471007.1 hypothetical protein [Bacillus sp. 31A1R]